MKRRFALAGIAGLMAAGSVLAQDAFPNRPVRIIVNSTAGGWLDLNARVVGQAMSESLGQPVIIENRAGGEGRIGIHYVKSAPADGYTLLAFAPTLVVTPALVKDPGYDYEKDFQPIGPVTRGVFVIVTGANNPDKNFRDFVQRARANPNKLFYASPGSGTLGFLASEAILKQADLKVQNVPYKGAAPTMTDVMAGRVEWTAAAPGSAMPMVRSGKLRVLGVTSEKRLPYAPDVPTLAEQGMPNFGFYQWHGLLAPAGIPAPVLQKLSQALRTALAKDSVVERMKSDWAEPWVATPTEFTRFLKQDADRYAKFASDFGLVKQ